MESALLSSQLSVSSLSFTSRNPKIQPGITIAPPCGPTSKSTSASSVPACLPSESSSFERSRKPSVRALATARRTTRAVMPTIRRIERKGRRVVSWEALQTMIWKGFCMNNRIQSRWTSSLQKVGTTYPGVSEFRQRRLMDDCKAQARARLRIVTNTM
jgi:hypothetical protein